MKKKDSIFSRKNLPLAGGAIGSVVLGHVVLERFGVPHGVAETFSETVFGLCTSTICWNIAGEKIKCTCGRLKNMMKRK